MQQDRSIATIGILTANSQDEHISSLVKELCLAFQQNNFYVLVFHHLSDFRYIDDNDLGEIKMEQYIPYSSLSAMILISETIKNDSYLKSICEHATEQNVPVFSLLRKLDGCFSITFDYKTAFNDLIRHVIKEHHATNINLIAGNEEDDFTRMALASFFDILAENNLPADGERISLNNMDTYDVRSSVKDFLSSSLPLPDAILCASDEMAFSVIEELKEHYLMVPDDIIVTGFGSVYGETLSPYHLTSAVFPLDDAIELITEIIEEHFINPDFINIEDNMVIPTRPIYAHSCGCQQLTSDIVTEQMMSAVHFLDLERSYRNCINHLQSEINKNTSIDTLATELKSFLQTINIRDAFLCLNPYFVNANEDEENISETFSGQMLLLCSSVDGNYEVNNLLFSLDHLLPPKYYLTGNYKHLEFFPLHIMDNIYGYLALCITETSPIRCILDLVLAINNLLGSIQNHIEFVRINRQLRQLSEQTVLSLSNIIEEKSEMTGLHVKRVSEYSRVLAMQLGLPQEEVDNIRIAAMMHDIGKINIPPDILDKPGKLTGEEFLLIQSHVTDGNRLLKNAPGKIMQMAARIALEHHEKWNGKGYLHWKGEKIHLESRIVALADVFDALVSKRPYKEPYPPEKAFDIILKDRGEHFDPDVVDAFVAAYDEILDVWNRYPDEKAEF